jgi:hypothetical protein
MNPKVLRRLAPGCLAAMALIAATEFLVTSALSGYLWPKLK